MAKRGYPRDDTRIVDGFSRHRMRAARERHGVSQRTLAEALGLHPDAVRDWENGTLPMRERSLRLVCFVLGVAEDCLTDPPIGQGAGV